MSPAFRKLVYALLAGDPRLVVEAFRPDLAVLRGTSRTVVVVPYVPDEAELLGRLRSIMALSRQRSLEVALVGGPQGARKLLGKATPWLQTHRVSTFHLPETGPAWPGRRGRAGSSSLGPAIGDIAEGRGAEPDWPSVRERIERDTAHAAARHDELAAFGQALAVRRPVATYALLAAIALVFALEVLWGGSTSTPVLVRMGALVPRRVFAGEYHRLFSCAFLHAGPVHLFFNAWVLYALGSFLERVLGTARFLVLYASAALAGSLASALVRAEGLSVGASGALWGLLAAEAVVAFKPGGLIPGALAEGARRAAVTNLVLNVLNSFRPHIDATAHFGGGVAGAVLLLTGVLTRGVPRLAESPQGRDRTERPPLLPVSIGLALLLSASVLLALGLGRPWELRAAPTFRRVSPPGSGLSFEVPALLGPATTDPSGGFVYGDLQADPCLVAVASRAVDRAATEAGDDDARAGLKRELAKPDEGATPVSGPRDILVRGERGASARYSYPSGLVLDRAVLRRERAVWTVEVLIRPEFLESCGRGLAERTLESIRSED